jgi:vitamin B12 transporter
MVALRTGAAFAAAPVVFLLAAATAVAAPAPAPSPSPLSEIGRISTSDRHDEPIANTTRTTFVVTQAQIQTRGDKTIADALEDVPGVEIYRYGAFGAQANIFVRGASSTNVLILLDGVPVTPASDGQIDLGTLSTAGVRSIEVVEGAGSTLYGSAAVGGVVNIITSVPRGTYLDVSGGSYDDRDLRVGVGNGQIGASFERHIAANDFGYAAIPVPGATPIPPGVRSNADAEQTAARVAYDANLGNGWSARLRVGSDQLHLGVPGSVPDTDAYARDNTSRDDAHLDITHSTLQSSTTLTLFGSRQIVDFVDPSAIVTYDAAGAPVGTENPIIDGRAQVSLRQVISGGASTFVTGVDVARESAVLANLAIDQTSPPYAFIGYDTTGVSQAQSAIYAQEQYGYASGVRWTLGLRAENDAPLGGAVTPSAGIALPIGAGLRLVANAGTAFTVPTIVDRYYPGFSNPDLKPERSADGDVSLQANDVLGGASIGIFDRNSTDLIQVNSQSIPYNVAQAQIRGILATLRTRPAHGFVGTFSITDTYKAANLAPGAEASRLLFTPVFVAKLGLEHGFGSGSFAYGAQANVFGPHEEDVFGSVGEVVATNEGQATVDAYVRERFTRSAILSLRVNNVGNAAYQSILGYPAPGRTFVVELSTR